MTKSYDEYIESRAQAICADGEHEAHQYLNKMWADVRSGDRDTRIAADVDRRVREILAQRM